jgi:hypothetical protein
MPKELPDKETLNKLFSYDAVTGKIAWKERGVEQFNGAKTGTDIGSADWAMRHWNKRFAGKEAGCLNTFGYTFVRLAGVAYVGHRIVWAMHHGITPADEIDHINHDRADNRLCNLRVVTRTENLRNRTAGKVSKYGVPGIRRLPGGNYQARINDGTTIGTFPTLDDAIAARREAEREHGYHPNHYLAA